MISKFLESWHCKNTGLLAIRLGLGIIFLAHGVGKLMDMDGTIGFFSQFGLPVVLAWIVAFVETIFGFGMILGMFTKIGGILLAVVMLGAIIKVKFPQGGFMAFELELMLMLSALGISLTGPGKYSLGNEHCGCVGGKCGCSSASCCGGGHASVCKNCSDGKCSTDGCKDGNCGCANCKNDKCEDCANCEDKNCRCKVCKNK